MQRRTFLGLTGLALGAAALGGWQLSRGTQPLVFSARNDAQGKHYAVGFYLDGRQAFATQVPERCHDVVPHPTEPLAVFVGRRPSRESYLIDTQTGRLLQTITTPNNRHFYGHGVFYHDGSLFYTTENDTSEPGRGVLGIYAFKDSQLVRIGEQPTHGVGPHQLLWMPDGEHLVVANGGIRTEADSRQMMNLDAMEPSLVIMHRDGRLMSRETLPDQMTSIRHSAVAKDGTIVSGQQYEGDPDKEAQLVAIKRPGQPYQAFKVESDALKIMQHYTASVAINSELRQLAITAPRGNRIFIWDLDTQNMLLSAPFADCAGVASVAEGFVASSGMGRCRLFDSRTASVQISPLELPAGLWDNHWRIG